MQRDMTASTLARTCLLLTIASVITAIEATGKVLGEHLIGYEVSPRYTGRMFNISDSQNDTEQRTTTTPMYYEYNLSSVSCKVLPAVPGLHKKVHDILQRQVKLVHYEIDVVNYTVNPLLMNTTWNYKLNNWARVSHSHGQTILSLAFNYGILSLMTLSFGVQTIPVSLMDRPSGCLGALDEAQKASVLLDLLMRDLKTHGPVTLTDGQSLCRQILKQEGNSVKFTNQCCFQDDEHDHLVCTSDIPNFWLTILNTLIAAFTIGVFLVGPMFTPNWLYSAALDIEKYVVKLKEPLYKSMCICCGDANVEVISDVVIDIRNEECDFAMCRKLASELPKDTIIPIKISQFDIRVNYGKCVSENKVPVGMWESVTRAVFLCKLRNVGPFQDCCESNIWGCLTGKNAPWLGACKLVGRLAMVVFLPIPFYIRLVLYYLFENPEIKDRMAAADKVNKPIWYDYRLLQYLTPTNPLFIAVYGFFFTSGFAFAYLSLGHRRSNFHQIIIDAYRELMDLSWLSALGMLVGNIVWPFKKFGIFGCLIGLIYWPIVMPISLVACLFYSLPLIFLMCRILVLSFTGKTIVQKDLELPGQFKKGLDVFKADKLIEKLGAPPTRKLTFITRLRYVLNPKSMHRCMMKFLVATICILTLISIMVMFTECFSFVLHVCVFTMMGIIVNASKVLKYGSLIFLVVIYSYDCYNNVYKKYLKLNKSLFSEIKYRIKDVDEVTSLPSYLQENRGFKSEEGSEQAEHESEDAISHELPCHWNINDLILFIDNDDTPRIPRQLFDDACSIQVAGSPGPVYRSLLSATGKFLIIILFVVFVFMVVLTFGDVYRVSSTNQMLATMAGGFMPMIFSKVLRPAFPDLELGSVSFKGKLEEIIKNFVQSWPLHDFVYDVEEREEEDSQSDDSSSENEKKGKDKKEKGKKDKDKKDKDKKDKDKKDKSKAAKNSCKATKIDLDVVDSGATHAFHNNIQDDMKMKLSGMKSVRPAAGEYVDILIILPDDKNQDDWLMEWSSIGEYEEEQAI